MNNSLKRILSLTLALMMIVSMVPSFSMTASAATLTGTLADENIGLTVNTAVSDTGTWTADGTTITGTVKSAQTMFGMSAQKTALTITNNGDTDAVLQFDYTLDNGGSVAVNVGAVSGGKYSQSVAAGGYVTVTLTSNNKNVKATTLTITNLELVVAAEVTSNFLPAENGSYTVDGELVGETGKEATKLSSESYALAATANAGYLFYGWYSNAQQAYISYEAETNLTFTEDPQLTAHFISDDTALFGVGSMKYQELSDAIARATNSSDKTIVVLNGGTLSGSYTIPAGVTLLIPFDEANTCYTDKPAHIGQVNGNVGGPNAWQTPYAYRTLTLAADASITVEGAISVSAQHSPGNGSGMLTAGSPSGPYGHIQMMDGSKITVADGGALYAWGYITGAGSVTAESGAQIHENFQFTDFRGGSASLQMATSGLGVFPLSQYYVQNIEVPTTFKDGAKEYVYTSIYAANQINSAGVLFIGDTVMKPDGTIEQGMFDPAAGSSITKTYDGSKDRLVLDVYGDANINSLTVSLAGNSINSSDFVLPINNNISINIHSGTVVVGQDMAMQPGSSMTIDQGAELKMSYTEPVEDPETGIISYGNNLYIYDRDQWLKGYDLMSAQQGQMVEVDGKFVHTAELFRALAYAPGRTYNRSEADLTDVVFDINGTLIADGYIYTTIGGASVISSEKTGKVQMLHGAGSEYFTVQVNYVGGQTLVQYVALLTSSVQLKNGDGSYLATGPSLFDTSITPAAAGDIFVYNAEADQWAKLIATIKFDANGGTGSMADQTVYGSDNGKVTLNANAFTKEGYTFAGWNTAADGSGTPYAGGEEIAITEDITLYAQWEETVTYTITFLDENGNELTELTAQVEAGGSYTLPAVPEKVGSTGSWHWEGYGVYERGDNVTINENATFQAFYNAIYYDLFFDANGGYFGGNPEITVLGAEDGYEYGYVITDPGTPEREGYEFTGWNTAKDGSGTAPVFGETTVTGNTTYYAQWKIKEYTITWRIGVETAATTTVEHGETISEPEIQVPENYYGYRWITEIPAAATGDMTIEGVWTVSVNVLGLDGEKLEFTTGGLTWDTKTKVVDAGSDVYLNYRGTNFVEGNTLYLVNTADETDAHEITYASGSTVYPSVTVSENTTFQLTAVPNKYTITFVNEDGTELQSGKVAYGETPVYTGETPTKEGNAQYTYTFAGWDKEVVAVTGDATYTATYSATVNEYTITFVNEDGTELQSGKVPYGTVPTYTGETPTKAADVQYTYTFAGWDKEVVAVTGDATYTATYSATVNEYTITFVNEDGTELQSGKVPYGTVPTYTGETPTKAADVQYSYTFKAWDKEVVAVTGDATYTATYTATVNKYTITWVIDGKETTTEVEYGTVPTAPEAAKAADGQYTYTFKEWTPEIVAVTGDATYTAVFTKTGWVTDGADTYYIIEDEVAFKDQVAEVEGEIYFFDEEGYIVANKGLVRVVMEETGLVEYYYFGCNNDGCKEEACKADVYTARKDCVHWVEKTNDLLLPQNDYTFNENGVIVHHADTSRQGIHADENGVECYYIDGVKAYVGLIESEGDYYYVRTNGELVKGTTYWISKTNGLMKEGSYTFDEEGKMVVETSPATKTGIFEENGTLYYYEDGVKTYAGLIEIDGNWYYVKSNCEVVRGGIFWITKTNGEMKQGNYNFDETGKMIPMPEKEPGFTGIKDGYYYKDGSKYYAGLIEIDGFYYYVNSSCKVITGQTYWISKTNDLLPEKAYTFDDQGRMVIGDHPDVKNGLYTEGDKTYYYADGVKTYAGLIQIDGYWYYVKSDCSIVKDGTFYVTKNNGEMKSGWYTFDAQGRMVTE